MRYNFRVRKGERSGEFVIAMKCLECGYEEDVPLDVFSELFDPAIEENPAITCPNCDNDLLVPKDVYDQIKGNFVYKVGKR